MDVTVAICTRNRARLLQQTLAHLRALDVPSDLSWELVVVDNGSTDATPEVLRRAAGLPLRVLHEPEAGKSVAANRATDAAQGELLVWTDDDVRPAADWLRVYVDAAHRHPAAAFFGGRVRPWFESEPPRWLADGLDEVALAYALIDLGPEERRLASREKVNGPNMAIRREVARAHPWKPGLGPVAGRRVAGGESYVLDRIQRGGGAGYWIPRAVVDHFIPTTSMSLDHVRYRYRLHGMSLMLERRSLLGAARSLVSALLEAYPRYLVARALRRKPGRWLRAYRRAQTHLGKLRAPRT
ncbi:MAG: glycosyltransferase [Planctomycetota bacterium]|jgi:glycosyltransferase involved in cell wall biosynthesis